MMNNTKRFILKTMTLNNCTIGKLFLQYRTTGDTLELCQTIENPWLSNKPNVSCIPAGDYVIRPTVSPKFGETYYVESLHDKSVGLDEGKRTHILFHKGNTADDTQGCILPGHDFGVINNKFAVLNSSKAMTELLRGFDGYDYRLTIIRQ